MYAPRGLRSGTWSPEFYSLNSEVQTSEGHALLERLAPAPGEYILDIGCGDGRLTSRISQAGSSAIGIDLSPEMARASSARGVRVVVADALRLPFRGRLFDAVYSNAALHWVADHEAAVREFVRVLAPGGRVEIRTGAIGNQSAMEDAAVSVLSTHPFAQHRPNDFRSPWTMADPSQWASLLDDHGLEVARLALATSPTGWASQADARRWFRSIGHPFIDLLPSDLRDRYVAQVTATAWKSLELDSAFVRLVVSASLPAN